MNFCKLVQDLRVTTVECEEFRNLKSKTVDDRHPEKNVISPISEPVEVDFVASVYAA